MAPTRPSPLNLVLYALALVPFLATPASAEWDGETACADDAEHFLCQFKEAIPHPGEDSDRLTEEGEKMRFLDFVVVRNDSPDAWTETRIGICFAREITLTGLIPSRGDVVVKTPHKRECLYWDVGDLAPGQEEALDVFGETKLDRKGRQEYRRCGRHELNRGASLLLRSPHMAVFRTPEVTSTVVTEDGAGDCDGDGLSDLEELEGGSDSFDPEDPVGRS